MKPSKAELGEKQYSQTKILGSIRFGMKKYEHGIKLTCHKQTITLRNKELNHILTSLADTHKINLYPPHIFTLLKEKFDDKKKYSHIHKYLEYLKYTKPPYFEEHNRIIAEKQLLEEL